MGLTAAREVAGGWAVRRGLTPLFWSNVALHGIFELDMTKRLDYDRGPSPAEPVPSAGADPSG